MVVKVPVDHMQYAMAKEHDLDMPFSQWMRTLPLIDLAFIMKWITSHKNQLMSSSRPSTMFKLRYFKDWSWTK